MDEELQTAIDRLHAFSQSWNDDDVVDEVGHLTGKDLRLVVEHLRGTEAATAAGVTD
ncbi:hypothetical protein [Sphingomonas sp. TZW2008]|uniref:hypothetical protein n=1 Tax=Sphingomonas sp. TZW2008 TaxID=1917973 RepID=UPI0015C50147|nr:hypothetical protein [Sphingomonas sp. TZW2008]